MSLTKLMKLRKGQSHHLYSTATSLINCSSNFKMTGWLHMISHDDRLLHDNDMHSAHDFLKTVDKFPTKNQKEAF
jgi:hypothetical protein